MRQERIPGRVGSAVAACLLLVAVSPLGSGCTQSMDGELAAAPSASVDPAAPATPVEPAAQTPDVNDKIDADVLAAVARGDSSDVVVLLKDEESLAVRAQLLEAPSDLRVAHTETLARVLDNQKDRLFARLPMAHMTSLRSYRHLPAAFLRVHAADALMGLASAPEVERIVADRVYELDADPGANLALINQPAAAAAGKLGSGVSVAVLDTGTDYKRAAFGCTSPGVPSGCKVAYAADFAPDDNSLDDAGHGTNVSGIVLSVAPSAKILALDVFRGASGYSSDILAAINWTIANRSTYNIVALNLSLGSGSYAAVCGTDVFASALASARAAGIFPAVASGNGAVASGISSPACTPAAVSVGAVYPDNVGGLRTSVCSDSTSAVDKIACFSNSVSFLSLLAPGVNITAADITMSGTSQATPHVAGAAAALRAAFPSESVDTTLARLRNTGKRITDTRNNVVTPRIDLNAALASTAATTPGPSGTPVINAAAKFTKSAAVTVAVTPKTGTAKQVCLSNTETCTTWLTYAASQSWTLASGDGSKTVHVWWKDAAGNVSAAAGTASIILDTTAPSAGTVTAPIVSGKAAITWSMITDAGSGVASYRLVGSSTTTAPAASCTGAASYAGTATSFSVALPAAGKTSIYRLCALDAAGNINAGALITIKK